MSQKKLKISAGSQKYNVVIGNNLISKLPKLLSADSIEFKKCLLLIDKRVPKNLINKIKTSLKCEKTFYLFNANEKNKNIKTVQSILQILFKKNFSRGDCLISIGGGITGDIGGFTASLFKRGLKLVNIPTTLLAQVDSSIGGKTGVNNIYGKNQIGSFYQPNIVVSDIVFLKTLPKREFICGYGEILKHSLIANKKLYQFLCKNFENIINLKSPFIEKTIYESCKIKKFVVEKDEKEKNLRKILNFGHTFAHAYEASINFSNKLNHGEAVLLGINAALKFSLNNKILKRNDYNSVIKHIKKSNLPHNLKNYFSIKDCNKITSFMVKDKKNRSNMINLVLLKKIGSPIINKEYKKQKITYFLKNQLLN
ncbi:3-dehydroquinate synthase [Candidatus Pelagibacter sp.]|nr:3-dehydroquinate synthase [Candidatus Pelagibacter sp.]|tara:strand:+ start:286 stop:1389 length:1104 start_codon:yes stop_codon:yes gene_type:complete